jgi:hypothetical protein
MVFRKICHIDIKQPCLSRKLGRLVIVNRCAKKGYEGILDKNSFL